MWVCGYPLLVTKPIGMEPKGDLIVFLFEVTPFIYDACCSSCPAGAALLTHLCRVC